MVAAALAFLMALASPAYAAADGCTGCHPREAAALARTGMGRSFRVAAPPNSFIEFRHEPSGSRVSVNGNRHKVRKGSHTTEHSVAYVVGSGNAGFSYLLRLGDALFQSPVSYYSRRKLWDVSPGYEGDPVLHFSRPVPEECLFCHAGGVNPVSGSINRYADPPGPLDGIPCQRCHGDGDTHAAAPSRSNIVNPVRLAIPLRDAVCEQCHLSGETRVLNPGKRWQDFHPGTPIEDTFTTYVAQASDPSKVLPVISHVEQLAASACARESRGRLWCGSCHQVHGESRTTDAACADCHASRTLPGHAARTGTCAGCHMPRRPSSDGGHTSFTDHRIQKNPTPLATEAPLVDNAPRSLRAWRASPQDSRNLGLGYIQAGDRRADAHLMQTGFALLANNQRQFQKDPGVLAALGYVLLQKNRPREAAALLQQSLALEPDRVLWRVQHGLALAAAGDSAQALKVLEAIHRSNPGLPSVTAAIQALRAKPATR